MNFTDTLAEMLVLLFAMACGYAAGRLGILGSEANKSISKLLLDVTLPAMILGSVSTGEALPDTPVVLGMLGVAAVFYGLELVFTLAVPPLLGGTPGQKGVWRFTLFFGNIGFIGYPVAVAFFGPEALFYAVLLVLPFNLMAFTLGPLLLSGVKRFSLRRMFSPAATAALAALVLALTRLRPPEAVGRAVEFGAAVAAVCGLFAGGAAPGADAGLPPSVGAVGGAAAGHAPGAVPGAPGPGDGGAGSQRGGGGNGDARSHERVHAVHGARRGRGVHGPDHLRDHPGLHRQHSRGGGALAVGTG